MPVSITVEKPLREDVRELVAALSNYLRPLSPIEFQFGLTTEEMASADTLVFVARNEEGRAVGIGALKIHDDGTGEIKRMYTLPQCRGQRIGEQILSAIFAAARSRHIERLVLETGVGQGFEAAHRLYERSGFAACDAFLGYPDSGYSRFYEKRISQ